MLICGDVIDELRKLPAKSVHCCITSPPYFGLRDYCVDGQIGLEPTPAHYVAAMVDVFREVYHVLRDDGTLWLNLGDSYTAGQGSRNGSGISGLKRNVVNEGSRQRCLAENKVYRSKKTGASTGLAAKQLLGIPWRVAFALQDDGWYLRSDIIWHKPNPMPESARDRPTKAHEYMFLLSKQPRYYYDAEAVKEDNTSGTIARMSSKPVKKVGGSKHELLPGPQGGEYAVANGRNKRTVWTIPPKPFRGAHFACFPPALVEPCVKAGTSEAGCCLSCGAPRVRQTKKTRVATRPGADTKTAGVSAATMGNRDPQRHVTTTETVGWGWSCGCASDTHRPCTVLDPFSGAATTGIVAHQLGRDYIGIELNPEYHALAQRRLELECN